MLLDEGLHNLAMMSRVIIQYDHLVLQANFLIDMREESEDILSVGRASDGEEDSIPQIGDGSDDRDVRAPLFRQSERHRQRAVRRLPYPLWNFPYIGARFVHVDDFLALMKIFSQLSYEL